MVRLAVVFAFASAVGAARVQVDIAAAEAAAAAQAAAEAIAEEDSVEADAGQSTCPIGRRVRNTFGGQCAMALRVAGPFQNHCIIQYDDGRTEEASSMFISLDARCPQPQPTTTTTTTTRQWMTEPSLVIADGCPRRQGQLSAEMRPVITGRAAVRCCSMDGGHCETQTVGCLTGVSFFEANAACHSHGLRLCSRQELDGGVCCGTGCGYDGRHVWTFTPELAPQCAPLSDDNNAACRGEVSWAFSDGKWQSWSGDAYGNMMDVAGVTHGDASLGDFQRLFFCGQVAGTPCGLAPCDCTHPPCSTCEAHSEPEPVAVPGSGSYEVTQDTHCGGFTIAHWEGGESANYGRRSGGSRDYTSLAQCEAECDSQAECAGFNMRDSSGRCSYWKSGPLNPFPSPGNHCHRKN